MAARRIAETDLDTEDKLHDNNYPFIFNNVINMDNVKFQYGYRDVILDGINLKLIKDKIAIVGESGSGKSTIGKLLNHYYDVAEVKYLLTNAQLTRYN